MSLFARVFFVVMSLSLIVVPGFSQAEEWVPKKSITLQIPFGAGGSTDTISRLIATSIEKSTGWNIVVENKVGGAGVAMLSGLMHKKPDGLTVGVVVSTPILINLTMRGDKLPFTLDSFDYLGTITKGELALVAKGDAPFDDFEGFLAHIKETGDPISFDSKPQQIIFNAISKHTGIRMKLVSHKSGAEQIQSLLGGHVVAGCLAGEHIKYLQNKSLKMIAAISKTRLSYAPETKTLIEDGYDFYVDTYFYLATPKGLPTNVKTTLSKIFDDAINSTEVKDALQNVLKVGPYNVGADGTLDVLNEGLNTTAKLIEATK